MNISRREALAAAAAAGAAVIGGCGPKQQGPACEVPTASTPVQPTRKAKLKLSSQEKVIPGESLAEKFDKMEKWGFEGLEVGGKGLHKRVKELQDALKGRSIKMSAICAGFDGWLIAADKENRQKCVDSLKVILSAAGELGSTGVIIVPSFNSQDGKGSLPHKQAREAITGFARWDAKDRKRDGALLQELGDHAAKAGTRILIEPLNRSECYFIRTLADGASVCRDLENPGIALMGDFWHMTWEETSDLGAFVSAGDYLHHVHVASRKTRKMPGEDGAADNYVLGFKGLKMIGYQDYCSLECGCTGDREKAVPAAAELLRKQWAQA